MGGQIQTPAPAAFTFTIGRWLHRRSPGRQQQSVKAGSPLVTLSYQEEAPNTEALPGRIRPRRAQAGTYSYEVVFTPNEWASARYEIAAMTGTAEVTAMEDKPGGNGKPGEAGKPGETGKPGRTGKPNESNRTDDSDDSDEPERPSPQQPVLRTG